MIGFLVTKLLQNRVLILGAACALLITNAVTGFLAYRHGLEVKEAEYTAAALKASTEAAKANSEAMAREVAEVAKRVKTHTEINSEIEASHEKSDDDPVAPVLQRVFDRLRTSDGQARPH